MDEELSSSAAFNSANFDTFNSNIQTCALKTTRNALSLPADVAFHRSMDPAFSKELDVLSSRVLSLTSKLLSLAASADATQSARGKGKGKLENQDDVVDNFHSLVVDSMDQLLERTDICLDEFLGRSKPPAIAINPTVQMARKPTNRGHLDPVIQHASHLQKPQASFKRKVDNSDTPWHPTLIHKFNAKVPLGYDYRDTEADMTSVNLIAPHPYRYEITHITYPERMFQTSTPSPPKDFAETPFTWVTTLEDFQSMLSKLRSASEIAVDLEHHSYRTFAGFLCLMQISSREEDWIVDTLTLREELTDLNEIFTNPNIVKIFHGAESDIVWLQQDFNLYIVNLFDTYHASKALEFPRHGLANLLEMYCDFTPDKRYQLADWRIRPLPKEMLDYARSDTHFLLYIYDNLRNALIDRAQSRAQSMSPSGSPSDYPLLANPAHALIKQVLTKSEETSLRTFEKEVYDTQGGSGSNGWDTMARKWNKGALLAGGPGAGIGALQRAVYQAVHLWRDTVAREEDESTRYVLPNHFLFQLAEQPPADMAALLRIFHSVPPILRRRSKELLDVIRECVKLQLSNTSTTLIVPEVPEDDVPMIVDGTEESPKVPKDATSKLWSNASGPNTLAASSSPFGPALSATQKVGKNSTSFATSKSTLFGTVIRKTPVRESHPENPRFRELVARINSTLVIAPSAPKAVGNAVVEYLITQPALSGAPGMQVEIPYIPASQRHPAHTIEDSIVVVGQARQKKRKRTKVAPDGPAALPSAESSNVGGTPQQQQNAGSNDDPPTEESVPFDFSAVPNILDDNPNSEETKKKRQRKQKHGGEFYGDFPAPPKAHSELKRGNQSHTFK